MEEHHIPQAVQIRNAHVHNLKNIDVDIHCTRSWALRACPAPANPRWHWACCCGGLPALPGCPVHLTRRRMTPGRPGGRGRGAVRSGCAGPAPAARRPGHPQHLWHRDRAAQQPAAHVLPSGQPPLPQWALSGPVAAGGGRERAALPGMRGAVSCPIGRRAGLQLAGACPQCGGIGTVRTVDPLRWCRMIP